MVDKFIIELQSVLEAKQVFLDIDESIKTYLIQKGYDRLMGARPMARLIQEKLKKPLAQMILFCELSDGGHVLALIKDDEVNLQVMANT